MTCPQKKHSDRTTKLLRQQLATIVNAFLMTSLRAAIGEVENNSFCCGSHECLSIPYTMLKRMRAANVNKFTTVSSALRSFHRPLLRVGGVVVCGLPAALAAFSMERKYLPVFRASPTISVVCLGFPLFISLVLQFPFTLVHQMGILCVWCGLPRFQFSTSLPHANDRGTGGSPTTIPPPPQMSRILRPALDTQTNCQAAAHSPDLQLMDSTLFTICNRFAVKFCSDTSFIVFAGGIGFSEEGFNKGA